MVSDQAALLDERLADAAHRDDGEAREVARGALAGPSPAATLSVEAVRCFLAIVERGGVAAAAERVGRTPGAVSMQLKKLEETIGAPLFDRGARRMTLTPQGERMVGYARRFLSAHAEALDAFRQPDLEGSIRIGMNGDSISMRLSQLFARFAETHPLAKVSVQIAPSARLAEMLDAGELDLCLLSPRCTEAKTDLDWREGDRLVREEQLVWVGAAGGRAHLRDPLPMALATGNCSWRRQAVEALASTGRPWREAYVSDAHIILLAAAAADLAVSVAPASAAAYDPAVKILGPETGLPPLGVSRLAIRFGQDGPGPVALALAARIEEAFAMPTGGEKCCGPLAQAASSV